MKRGFTWANGLILCTSAAALSIPLDVRATGLYGDAGEAELVRPLLIKDANLLEEGDGSLSLAATEAMNGGFLPASSADITTKAIVNAAFDATAMVASLEPKTEELVLFGGAEVAASTPPSIVGGRSFQGQLDATFTPSDSAGAIGTTRYVQLVNRRFAIYSRTSATPLSSGTLNAFAGVSSTVKVFRPQVIWDPTTARFYYVMNATVSATNQRLAYGFSKTATPTTAADWCKYVIGGYGSLFPDFPRLGDTQHFAVVGVNVYNSTSVFQRADVLAIRKPPAGSTCPTAASLQVTARQNLKDTSGNRIFSPTPANQIDTASDGYIVARNLSLPSNRLWIFKVTRNATTGAAVIDAVGKALTLPFTTSIPPDATQGGLTQKIDTGDTRLTQAVLAINPLRGATAFSLWTQQTVANNGTSAVRAYEINPVSTTPTLRRTEIITTPLGFVYNAAISSDRRVDGATKAFGGSVVIAANASSAFLNIPPGIGMGSSVNGSKFYSGALVKAAIGPYRDSTCKTAGSICRWGDSSSAAPDPRPATTGTGAVWFTNQYSGFANPQTTQANWRTWIWAAKP